jgi:hypothetical protein
VKVEFREGRSSVTIRLETGLKGGLVVAFGPALKILRFLPAVLVKKVLSNFCQSLLFLSHSLSWWQRFGHFLLVRLLLNSKQARLGRSYPLILELNIILPFLSFMPVSSRVKVLKFAILEMEALAGPQFLCGGLSFLVSQGNSSKSHWVFIPTILESLFMLLLSEKSTWSYVSLISTSYFLLVLIRWLLCLRNKGRDLLTFRQIFSTRKFLKKVSWLFKVHRTWFLGMDTGNRLIQELLLEHLSFITLHESGNVRCFSHFLAIKHRIATHNCS